MTALGLNKDQALEAVRAARWTNSIVGHLWPETEYAREWRQTVLVDARLCGCTLTEIGVAIGLNRQTVRLIIEDPGGWRGRSRRRRFVGRVNPKVSHLPKRTPATLKPNPVMRASLPLLSEYRAAVRKRRLDG